MTIEFSMHRPLMNSLIRTADELQAFVDEQRKAFAAMPEDWHDGDQAESVDMWLDDLDRAIGEINDIQFGCME